MYQIGAVALGGAIGSIFRFILAKKIQNIIATTFPLGVLLVNITGCFLIGFLTILFIERFSLDPIWRASILVGFLGGFTTFSTFSIDTLSMIESSDYFHASLYILLSLFCCLFATWVGILLGRNI